MNVIFTCCWILVISCILFGIYEIFKKKYDVALGNMIIPILFMLFYFLTVSRLPGTSQVNELSYFIQQVQKFHPFAICTLILLVMFIMILIWDIITIRKTQKMK